MHVSQVEFIPLVHLDESNRIALDDAGRPLEVPLAGERHRRAEKRKAHFDVT
jgi:hypothetical protein